MCNILINKFEICFGKDLTFEGKEHAIADGLDDFTRNKKCFLTWRSGLRIIESFCLQIYSCRLQGIVVLSDLFQEDYKINTNFTIFMFNIFKIYNTSSLLFIGLFKLKSSLYVLEERRNWSFYC